MIDDIAGIMVVNQEQECWCLCLVRSNWNVEEHFQHEIHIPGFPSRFFPANESGLHLPDKRCVSKYQSSKKSPFIHQFYISSDPLVCWDMNRTLTPADPHRKEDKMNNSVKLVQRLPSVIRRCCITYVCWPVFASPWHQSQRCKCAHADESEEFNWKAPWAYLWQFFWTLLYTKNCWLESVWIVVPRYS